MTSHVSLVTETSTPEVREDVGRMKLSPRGRPDLLERCGYASSWYTGNRFSGVSGEFVESDVVRSTRDESHPLAKAKEGKYKNKDNQNCP